MATRASVIVQARDDLGELGAGVSTTDSASQGNHFHFAINDALARMGLSDSDLDSASNDTLRILRVGVAYYVIRALVKKMISIPRISSDQVSRDHFARTMELLRWYDQEFRDALSGADVPREASKYAEEVVTWATGMGEGGDGKNREGDNYQSNVDDNWIDDMGVQRGSFNNDGN